MPKELEVMIKEIIPRTHNVKSFRFELKEPIDFSAGQFLQVITKTEPALKRYLSISSSPTESYYIEFTKKLTQSDFSKVLDRLKPGDPIKVQLPLGKFTLRPEDKKIAFISGGIGITPIRSICKYAADKNLDVDIILIYANQSIKDIIFHDELEKMQEVYPKFKLAHVLCEPAPGLKCSVGLINSRIIKNEVPDYQERRFFLCGPVAMVEAMRKILLEELKLPSSRIITENFVGY